MWTEPFLVQRSQIHGTVLSYNHIIMSTNLKKNIPITQVIFQCSIIPGNSYVIHKLDHVIFRAIMDAGNEMTGSLAHSHRPLYILIDLMTNCLPLSLISDLNNALLCLKNSHA